MSELPTSGFVGAATSRELLAEVAALQHVARRPAGLWPPLVTFGAAAAIGAPLGLLGDTAVNLWWLAVGGPGLVLVARRARRHAHARGIDGRSLRLWILGVASFAAAWLGVWLAVASNLPASLGWVLAVALCYLAWSRLARSIPAAAIAVMILVVGLVLTWSPVPAWTVQLGVGLVMLTGGAMLRLVWEAV